MKAQILLGMFIGWFLAVLSAIVFNQMSPSNQIPTEESQDRKQTIEEAINEKVIRQESGKTYERRLSYKHRRK